MKKNMVCVFTLLVCCMQNLNALNGGFSRQENECEKSCSSDFGTRHVQQYWLNYKMKKIIVDSYSSENEFKLYEEARKKLQLKFYEKNLKLYYKCLKKCYKA